MYFVFVIVSFVYFQNIPLILFSSLAILNIAA